MTVRLSSRAARVAGAGYLAGAEVPMADRWSLYVDESGEFEGGPSVVAGVLLPASADSVFYSTLRKKLGRVWGPGPYPPHASTLNMPGSRLLFHVRRPRWDSSTGLGEGAFSREIGAACEELLGQPCPPEVQDVLDACESGAYPTYDRSATVDAWARDRAAYRSLRDACEWQGGAMGKLLSEVAVPLSGSSGDAAVFGSAADVWPHLVLPPPPEPAAHGGWQLELSRDAYVCALRGLFRRVIMLARPIEIDLVVLTRDVVVGGREGVPMQSWFIKQLIEEAQQGLPRAVTFRVRGVQHRYSDRFVPEREVHPGCVLADWAANRLLQAGKARTWPALSAAAVERALVTTAGHLEQAPHGRLPWTPLPTVACEGVPQERIEHALQSRAGTLANVADWTDDQANRLVEAANGGVWA